jgi:hypothetical protein
MENMMRNSNIRMFSVLGIGLAVWLSPAAMAFARQNPDQKPPRQEGRQERRQRRMRDDGAPKTGEVAPTLKLKTLDGKKEVDLASFHGKQPVVFFFGSYT